MAWSPDGRELAFSSDRDQAVTNIYRLPADGSGEPERLARSERQQFMASWSSEGVIAYLEADDIWVLPPGGDPKPFFTSEAVEADATFSPDGRWLAYVSDRSGRREVYVRPYPGPEPVTLISGEGGINPAWSPDGREIYYLRALPGAAVPDLVAVDVIPGDEFQVGRPTLLVSRWINPWVPVRSYDVLADGSFVFAQREEFNSEAGGDGQSVIANLLERLGATELHVILNWTEVLKERVPN